MRALGQGEEPCCMRNRTEPLREPAWWYITRRVGGVIVVIPSLQENSLSSDVTQEELEGLGLPSLMEKEQEEQGTMIGEAKA